MAPTLPLILLPPSEGKTPGGSGDPWRPGTMAIDLDERRREVLESLEAAMAKDDAARSKLLGVKGEALAAATAANSTLTTSPTLRAIDRYSGVLYGALEPDTLGTLQRRRLDASVLIVSGLWGLVAPRDPIPDYKLKMGASLPGTGTLSTWWRDAVTDALSRRGAGRRVWNLLPNEHDAAWRPADVPSQVRYSVRFLDRRDDGSLVAVSHWNKFLKGALVRFLLEFPDAGPAELAEWEHPSGYRLDPGRTEEDRGTTRLSFVRTG